ncbi:glycoside hydrolase family 15 protein [Streptomyces rubradiris]|uniref:glycoside hydrolase family 15 protein n=1 Tax=Streptomyces rubradiris TaxID=285531 RepID=UPI0036E0C263
MKHFPLIEQYGLIGGMRTAAQVCDDGSIDWLCLPRFDSDAVFARLVGEEKHGSWRLAPVAAGERGSGTVVQRRYVGDSAVLESVWETPTGTVRVTDFMPSGDGGPRVVRIVEGVAGQVPMVSTMRPRPGYGRVTPWVHRVGERVVAEAGADALWLDAGAEQTVRDGVITSAFTVAAGQSVAFVLSWAPSTGRQPRLTNPQGALAATLGVWEEWAERCTYDGPYRDAVVRSLITLKLLIYAPSGGMVAAPSSSLPEAIGLGMNYDYRYGWLRDSATVVVALLEAGFREEAEAWRRWLLRSVAGDPENLQILYSVTGEREVPERVLDWLPGYEGSVPVRIGNAAAKQLQLDVYGDVFEALYLADERGVPRCEDTAVLHQRLVQYLIKNWQEPDEGIWEIRGARRHFVHSKVMAWAAADRTIRLAEAGALDVDLFELIELREAIHREVCEKGFDPVRNTFTQSYGSKELDAALLLIPLTGFLPPDDPRVIGTIEAVQRELTSPDGLVYRYVTADGRTGVSGFAGHEGTFLLCSFWLVDTLAVSGRLGEARALFERLLALRNDLGLLAEEYDPEAGRQLGNFPQAFSHKALVRSAVLLHRLSVSTAPSLPVPVMPRPASSPEQDARALAAAPLV